MVDVVVDFVEREDEESAVVGGGQIGVWDGGVGDLDLV